eukprot:1138257-Pelagomonas_calceolata.AAC.3
MPRTCLAFRSAAAPSPHSLSAALPFTAATTGAQARRATDGEEWEHAAQGRGAALRGIQGHTGLFQRHTRPCVVYA